MYPLRSMIFVEYREKPPPNQERKSTFLKNVHIPVCKVEIHLSIALKNAFDRRSTLSTNPIGLVWIFTDSIELKLITD